MKRSPQAWGWTAPSGLRGSLNEAFPTGVGMDRATLWHLAWHMGVPHRRGDGPGGQTTAARYGSRSPQAWGWTGLNGCWPGLRQAFPTGVGMDRRRWVLFTPYQSVPHRRGDGPS